MYNPYYIVRDGDVGAVNRAAFRQEDRVVIGMVVFTNRGQQEARRSSGPKSRLAPTSWTFWTSWMRYTFTHSAMKGFVHV